MEKEHANESYYAIAKRLKAEARNKKPPKKKYAYSIPGLGIPRMQSDKSLEDVQKFYQRLYPEREIKVIKLKK